MTRLSFDIKIDITFYDEELTKLKEYYEERVPELTVLNPKPLTPEEFYFNEEFVEVLRQKYMYEIEKEIKSIIN
tara:strand:- start:8351 stop:8572 length:222 start_codon:yes stop_codon:yes gene_type:complete